MSDFCKPRGHILNKEDNTNTKYVSKKIQEIINNLRDTKEKKIEPIVAEVKIIDFNDPKVQERMRKCREAQEEILSRKIVDPKIRNEQITI